MTADVTIVAMFTVSKYTITVTATAGGVATGSGEYTHGESVTVTATPNDKYTFAGWYDESNNLVDSAPSYTFTANNTLTLTAKFDAEEQPTDPISLIVADGFDNGADTFTASDRLNKGAGADAMILTSGAISGTKSLQLTTNALGETAGFNIMMMSDFGAGYMRTYIVNMKLKVTAPAISAPQVYFRMVNAADAQVNGLVLNTDGTTSSATKLPFFVMSVQA